jgi:hypothetical protein
MTDVASQLDPRGLVNFLIGRKQDDLVTGVWKVALDKAIAVGTIETPERRVDYYWQWLASGAGQAPEKGDG